MTTLKTYSHETVNLTPNSKAKTSKLSLTGSASLMTNYEPARSVDSGHHIKAIEDKNGDPIIFSVGTGGELFAIMRGAPGSTGWRQVNLTGNLNCGPVETFDVLQMPDKKFVVVASLNENKSARLFTTPTLDTDPDSPFWNSFSNQWHELTQNAPALTAISALTMGSMLGGKQAAIMATGTKDGVNYDRYAVTGTETPWALWPVPQNAHTLDGKDPILDIALGVHPTHGLAGAYTLYFVGSDVELVFTSFEKVNGQIVYFQMSPPKGAAALSTASIDPRGTDLFVMADGAYCFTAQDQIDEAAAEQISDGQATGEGQIQVLCDSKKIAVWTLQNGVLSYIQGNMQGEADWSTPVPLSKDTGQITALRNSVRKTNELFMVDASNQLNYFYQDPSSTIWHEVHCRLSDTGKAIPVQCYTSVLTFKDSDGCPWVGDIEIGATSWVAATVNGQSHMLSEESTVTLPTDPTGKVTIITRTTTASTPMITVGSPTFNETVDMNPASVINDNLKQFTSADALRSAKTQNGESVLDGQGDEADAVARAFQHLTAASDAATSTTFTIRSPGQGPANRVIPGRLQQAGLTSFAISTDADGTLRLLEEADLETLSALGLGGTISASFGDVTKSILNGLEHAGQMIFNVVETAGGKALEFVIHIGDKIAHFALDTLEKVYQALALVLDKIKMGLRKLIEWLGHLLGWDDVRTAQKIIVNSFNKMLDYTADQVEDLRGDVDTGLEMAQQAVSSYRPENAPKETMVSAIRSGVSSLEETLGHLPSTDTPGTGFLAYHVLHNGSFDEGIDLDADLSGAITDFLNAIEKAGMNVFEGWKKIFKDIFDGIKQGNMSIGDMLKMVLTDQIAGTLEIAKSIADGALDVFDDFVKVIKDILNKTVEIPFFSGLFELITGTKTNLLDLFAFMFALPATEALRIVGVDNVSKDGAVLADEGLSPQEFRALVGSKSGETPTKAALLYNRIVGAVSIEIGVVIDLLTTLNVALAQKQKKLITGFKVLFMALKFPLSFPAMADKAHPLRIVSYIVTGVSVIANFVLTKALPNKAAIAVGAVIALLTAAVQYVINLAIGILAAVGVDPSAGAYVLIWATTSTQLCNVIESGLQALIAALMLYDDPTWTTIMVALGVTFAVWFVFRPILNTARLAVLCKTGSNLPYWPA